VDRESNRVSAVTDGAIREAEMEGAERPTLGVGRTEADLPEQRVGVAHACPRPIWRVRKDTPAALGHSHRGPVVGRREPGSTARRA